MNIEQLNNKYGIAGKVVFSNGKGGLQTVTISNELATAVLSIHGAHVMHYQPANQQEVLWMSDKSVFEEGKPIRGGIPLCFPWFGPHASESAFPQHGFARLINWEVTNVESMADGATKLELEINTPDVAKTYFNYSFIARLTVTVGAKLQVTLSVLNIDNKPFTYSDALHTYFNVSDVNEISIDGLRTATYYEAFGTELKRQEEPLLNIVREENRRYVNTTADCIIYDKGLNRKIRVAKTGSKVTVVWNPGEANAKTIADIGENGHKHFICVEAVNAYEGIDMITLQPGEQHSLFTTISVE
ncbi:D-hexose-6-phosphate mutarotase [Ferruginibacter albus]|uniref:D-hexose-6-phosphate mutarotase n=1 Tax=Ferruginibacter albus TaxID=2875540 RepID=UPI001CC62F79|nr:D-hexose-6-phosphate mutarotase [Ferruginibacter albus]UAY53631.1 D-hexose-6-phosphate mutarotase [Ferruginibacter albus]